MASHGGKAEEDVPLSELLERLVDDGRGYAQAELELVKAKMAERAQAYRPPLALGIAALIIATAALIALSVTLVLALAALLGPLLGGLIVTVTLLGIAALLAYLAKRKIEAIGD
ncbi:phage holin family protein [Sphingomonas xanthus]|uniref:Phage holin family protein n=1 Tax=Sphingomonas xanthus TaxID=2594473 RepID=A0A516INS7_9SPHN|nr:phage holin family protein [Sphingomonas xanthus]QDP18527.1 phage holin family protein [Sphingomonas xanthus]